MATVKTPHGEVGKTPVRKKKNNNSNNHAVSSRKTKRVYCSLCRKSNVKNEAQEHMHSMLHHRELETVLGKGSFHECQACKESSMGLNEYAQHISTVQHKAKLKSLMSKHVKPLPLSKTLGAETMSRILERNKRLKRMEKKAVRKEKKKQKQEAGHKRATMLQGAARKNPVVSKVVKLEKSKQANTRILKQMRETHQEGRSNAVVQNKENKVSSVQRPLHQRESTLQNQSRRLAFFPGEPAGRTWHPPNVQDQCTQSSHQRRNDDNFPVNDQCSKVQIWGSQTDRLVGRQHGTQRGATSMPGQMNNRQPDRYNKQYEGATDFTSDQLPQNGAIIFDHGQNASTGSSQPGREGSHSAQPVSANRSANAAPIRDVDVSAMLWQIRRALGVREPCRADREARRQNSEGGVRVADRRATQPAGTERAQPAAGSFSNHAKEATLRITSAASTSVQSSLVNMQRQTTVKMTQGTMVARDSNGPSNSRETDSPSSLSQRSGRTTSPEPKLNIARKVRIAHKSSKFQGEKEAELTQNKLLSISGAKSKLSWREMYEEMKRKKQERGKGKPRFGIELANPLSEQESSAQAKDIDLPLSEGFHWESLPDSPSGAHWTGVHPPPQGVTDNDARTETTLDSEMREPLEQPGAAQDSCSSQTVDAVSVKVEPNFEDENGDLRNNSGASKRKHKGYDGVSDKEPSEKKKKTKSNKDQDQMDQLLAVSLREEELSHSLQDLDESLVQARNVLQAAYTEVQRLLLLRQQCTAEVNSLRAKRIEILQGMQGGYSGAPNVAEKASAFSTGAAAPMQQPRLSPLPSSSAFPTSSSQQSPPTNPASSLSQPHPTPLAMPKMLVKQEICQRATVSCNPDTSQVPGNQPVSLFPSDLLPSLLVTSPRLAAPTTAVTSLKQLKTECSTSANTNPSPESSARQQGQVTREGFKDCGATGWSAREEVDRDSEEETGGNPGKPPAAEKPDGGNESDDSVEMMEPSNLVVIDIDESDNEEAVSCVPVHQEPPQKSVIVEFSSASTQTFQQTDVERKVKPTIVHVPPVCVDDEEPSMGAFLNHTGPVHGLQIHEGRLYTCSGDNTARAYDLMSRECQAVFEGHTNKVNCLLVSSLPNKPARLYTGSSDQTIRCYSTKSKKCVEQISLSDRVLCLHVAWNILFAGLANGSVASYDLKTLKELDVFECHGPRGVSCLGTSQEGARRVLLVGSYDSTISVRDAKSGLLLRSLEGHTKTVLCMKVVNDLVFSGSSDTSVHAHNIHTGELVRIYKGHGHAVTSIVILGKVMVTACLDKLVRVYELQSHDRLQVYGGHSDMVMCMAVHKSVIYTGCYDGSVQAVKLNLMKNYRCWWPNCSLIFGMAEHLVQHLLRDHSNPNLHTVKCRWRGCSTFFATQQSVRQELPEHMQSHVDNDSKVQP